MSNNNQAIARVLQSVLRSGRGKVSTRWLLLGCLLLGGYLFAEPWLEISWGVDLPGVHRPGVASADNRQPSTGPASTGPQAEKLPEVEPTRPATVDDLIRSDRETYTSPAGLRYSRGTAHRHHLRHLMAHTRNEPGRPVHGVFDNSDVNGVVRLVDEAYERAIAGREARKRTEGDRTVYVVDMGRRVGYVGGQSGARRGHPAAERIQLVLVGKKFITSYPRED